MRQAERATARIADTDVETAAGTQEEGTGWKQLGQEMKYAQTSKTVGAAAIVCRQHQQDTGYDIYRQPCHRYVILLGTRSTGYLTNLPQPTSDLTNLADSFPHCEFELARVEQNDATTPTGPDIRVLTLYRSTMPKPICGERLNRFDDEWTGGTQGAYIYLDRIYKRRGESAVQGSP